MKKIYRILLSAIFIFFLADFLNAEISFSGFAGAKADFYSSDEESFDPALKIQSFFSGQFSISKDVIVNTEFSLATEDLIDNSIFKDAPANFKIDEVSLVIRKQFFLATNYLSAFMGTYEPIGSDIFLRRQFGIQPLASKITESWLGLAGSIIYPVFGAGGADIIHFNNAPVAAGLYVYVNHELDDSYVFNSDVRLAGNHRYFTYDCAVGIGMPLNTSADDSNFMVVNTLYWRAGANILIGNAYTNSLFIQAGFSEMKFKKSSKKFDLNEDTTYLLFEPRFRTKKFQAHLTVFSLPEETIERFIFIDDRVGVNLNIFTDTLHIANKTFTFGFNTVFSIPDKSLSDLFDEPSDIFDDYNITVAPYTTTRFYNGELHLMTQIKAIELSDGNYGSAFKFNFGYKTQF